MPSESALHDALARLQSLLHGVDYDPIAFTEAMDHFTLVLCRIPGGEAILERYGSYVGNSTAPGSPYAQTRERGIRWVTDLALDGDGICIRMPGGPIHGKWTRWVYCPGIVDHVKGFTSQKRWLDDLRSERQYAKLLLSRGLVGLEAKEDIESWVCSIRTIVAEGSGYHADGCQSLFLRHRGGLEGEIVYHLESREVSEREVKEIQAAAGFLVKQVGLQAEPEQLAKLSADTTGVVADDVSKDKACRPRRNKDQAVPKRAWTQNDLNGVILEYKARRSSNYDQLHTAVQRGDKGAKAAAQKMFGRNAIARELGVKDGSRGMVSESPAWQEIARELDLNTRTGPGKKIGLEIASEEKATAMGDATAADVAKREVLEGLQERLRMAKNGDDRQSIESLITELHTGSKTPDEVLEVLEVLDAG